MTQKYTIEHKSEINDQWENAFPWQPLFNIREDAQINLNQWILGMEMQAGMDTDERNYRIVEA